MRIGEQQVYFSSAINMEEVADESVTLIITSPPYWNVRNYDSGNKDEIGFNQSYESYIESLNKVWTECIRVLQPNGKVAINVQPLPISAKHSGFDRRVILDIMHDIQLFFKNHDFFLSGMNFWDKSKYINNVSWGSYPKPTNIATNTSFEQIYTFVKRGKTRKTQSDLVEKNSLHKNEWRHWAVRCIWDDVAPVIKINSKKENLFGHSAPFPEEIPYRLIRMHTLPGEIVLDPFLGSGTTLKVCQLLGRRGIGYEINQAYKEKIKARVQEEWSIPLVPDPVYITLGSSQLWNIIKMTINNTLKNIDVTLSSKERKDNVINTLVKEGLISKATAKTLQLYD